MTSEKLVNHKSLVLYSSNVFERVLESQRRGLLPYPD